MAYPTQYKLEKLANPSTSAKFWNNITVHSNGCWTWNRYRDKHGYGVMCVSAGFPLRAHSVSWFLKNGSLPAKGMHLDHLCRNEPCCNPEHLEEVTPRVNIERGNSFIPLNSFKTHCPKGHPYNQENTCVSKGGRYCRTCARAKATKMRPGIIARIRAAGLCQRCHQVPSVGGRSMCQSCLKKHATYNRERRFWQTSARERLRIAARAAKAMTSE